MHGFLGKPTDWNAIVGEFKGQVAIHCVDYMESPLLNSENTYELWGENFNKYARTIPGKKVLVGYSLGGRLAMHALENEPNLWSAALLLSTNPGFRDSSTGDVVGFHEREIRWLSDTEWSILFKQAPWEPLIKSWNNQPVFEGSHQEPKRLENEYNRDLLELALTTWSVASQKNLRNTVRENVSKLVFMAGERDSKYVGNLEQLKIDIPELTTEVVPESSHRILFDAPKSVVKALKLICHKLI